MCLLKGNLGAIKTSQMVVLVVLVPCDFCLVLIKSQAIEMIDWNGLPPCYSLLQICVHTIWIIQVLSLRVNLMVP